MSINRASISGNLTRDPDFRITPSGMAILGFSVAVNERRKNQQTGEWEDYPSYIDCVIFGRRAEAIKEFIFKGSKVAVEGRLRQDRWQDKNTGQNRSKIQIVVDEIDFMSSRNGGNYNAGQGQSYGTGQGSYHGSSYNAQPASSTQSVQDHQDLQSEQTQATDAQRSHSDQQLPNKAPTPGAYDDEDIPF